MLLCDFVYVAAEGERYTATCRACGRVVRTKTTKAVASCRSAARSARPTAHELMQAAGVAMSRAPIRCGPGTELKRLLKNWLGIEPTAGCECNSMAARMDALGVEWCESDAGMAEIVNAMREEHAKRKAAGQTILPWTDLGARQLVLLACRRARNAVDTP